MVHRYVVSPCQNVKNVKISLAQVINIYAADKTRHFSWSVFCPLLVMSPQSQSPGYSNEVLAGPGWWTQSGMERIQEESCRPPLISGRTPALDIHKGNRLCVQFVLIKHYKH